MANSLLFLPDISGCTQFVQTTEVEHSQHVIAELLEVLISANTENLQLAEIEGDALFFYKEDAVPSQERLLALIESMFTAFYSHLKKFETHRICPCNACATAPNLKLKIIAHSGQLQHIEVQGNRKPFGQQVIEAHRLLKNSVAHDNYALISRALALDIQLLYSYSSKLFRFRKGKDSYDGKEVEYLYSIIDTENLPLETEATPKLVEFNTPSQIALFRSFNIDAASLYEFIANYAVRQQWINGEIEYKFDPNEVSRVGTEHQCVVNGKVFDFVTVNKPVPEGALVYGEHTTNAPLMDQLYQFYTIYPKDKNSSELRIEAWWTTKSPLKKLLITLIAKRALRNNFEKSVQALEAFVAVSRENQAQ